MTRRAPPYVLRDLAKPDDQATTPAFTVAGGPYYFVVGTDMDRVGFQGAKTTASGGGSFAFYVTLLEADELPVPSDGGAVSDQRWRLDTAIQFDTQPVDASEWYSMPIQISGQSLTRVLVQFTPDVDVPADSLQVWYKGVP